MGEVVTWVDSGEHLSAMGTEEAESAFAAFGRRTIGAEGGDGDGHGQVIADVAQQFSCNHGCSDASGGMEAHVGGVERCGQLLCPRLV